jgi:rsbT co-antagonist protein RsbR
MATDVPAGDKRTRAARSLAAEMGIDSAEVDRRRALLELGGEDDALLRALDELAQRYADPVIEDFYRHLLSFEVGRRFFRDRAVLERVKAAQKRYFLGLTRGDYGATYVEDRLSIGAVHERIGLPVAAYLGMYNFYLRAVSTRLFEAYAGDPARALRALHALLKLIFLDIGLALDTYVFQRERTIRLQQEAIRELSTPVLQVRAGLLILPIVGVIDTVRARQLTEQLLRTIRAQRARVVVIDVTGVPAIDSKVANHLVQTVEATRLMGARVILTGLSPEIAQTLVVLGVDLAKMRTVGDLEGGIEEAERLLGYPSRKPGEALADSEDDDDR